ncbi:MAG: hypothetical protein HY591_06630 [Candidatus Omnitrophica bacterium]|nr:hypothetical protein [Candidatus Omnitrophota bacterium]
MSVMAPDFTELRRRNTFSIGLMIALSSWALVFFTLVWGYVVFRLRAPSWLGDHVTSPVRHLVVFNTLAMAMSSWSLSISFKKDVLRLNAWAWSAFALGLVFLAGQFRLWQMTMATGLHWQSSIAGSFFFLLTGFHALHILGAVAAVFMLCLRFKEWQGTSISLGIKYFWDFLFIVWLVMFVLIFIIQ